MSSSGTQIAFGAAAAVALGLGYLSYNNSRKATPFTATHGQTLPTAGPPAGVKGVDVFSANYIEVKRLVFRELIHVYQKAEEWIFSEAATVFLQYFSH